MSAEIEEQTVWLVEIKQAGLFRIAGFEAQARNHMLGSFCPGTLFPFAREAVADLIGKGKLSLKDGRVLEQGTYHDPCYLGRQNGDYDAPRETLAKAGMTLLEMDRNREGSFCCGAGGAQMWKEEEHGQQAVSANRYAEAQNTGAGVLATGCPFCAIMMNDANVEAGETMSLDEVEAYFKERRAKQRG